MTEDFLHYLWRFKKINIHNLKTIKGEKVELVKFGIHNTDSGPDFSDAQVRIDGQLWAGNIEIHLLNSDWRKHKHQNDEAYKNVILHVVYQYDAEIVFFKNGPYIPCIELKGRIDEKLYWKYENLLNSVGPIVCYNQAKSVDSFIKETMLHRLMVERMEWKTQELSKLLELRKGDWNLIFYQFLFRGFGLKVNAEPMRILALQIPPHIIYRHRGDLEDIEALLFGVAGFLQNPKDDYSRKLHHLFRHLKRKYNLSVLDSKIWKFSRMRPNSFPSIRIAQLAAWLFKNGAVFNQFLEEKELFKLEKYFEIEVSDYWKNHFRFAQISKGKKGELGNDFKQILILNVILPVLFLYGKEIGREIFQDRAFDLLEQLNFEKNQITRIYQDLNFPNSSAFYSQALLQLNQFYCKPKKCLNCKLGTHLMTIPK